jgi:PDZ domain
MKLRRSLTALALLVSIAGSPTSVLAKEKPPSVKYDPYTKTTTINGRLHSHNALLDLDKWMYWLSAAIVQGIPKNPVLMFYTTTPDWYFFDRAADVQGNELSVIRGGNSVQLGGVQESFGIQMTPKYLADHRTTGFDFKIMGSGGSRVVQVPAEVVAVFEETYLKEVAKAGGFREDLAATQALVAPTPKQIDQVAAAGASEMAAKGGFGISFAMIPQGLILIAVAPDSRAEKAKLRPGQLVTAINGRSTISMTQVDATSLLKSVEGATIFSVAGLGDLIIAP